MTPAPRIQRQQQLPVAMTGSDDSTPIASPPTKAGCANLSVVVLTAEVRDQLLTLEVPQRVLQLHQLDEQIVLGIEPRGVHRTLEVEREPLLDAGHAGA